MTDEYRGAPRADFSNEEIQDAENQKKSVHRVTQTALANCGLSGLRRHVRVVDGSYDELIAEAIKEKLRELVFRRLKKQSRAARQAKMARFDIVLPLAIADFIEQHVDPLVRRVLLDERPTVFHERPPSFGRRKAFSVGKLPDKIKSAAIVMTANRYQSTSDFSTSDSKSDKYERHLKQKVAGVLAATAYGIENTDWRRFADDAIIPKL